MLGSYRSSDFDLIDDEDDVSPHVGDLLKSEEIADPALESPQARSARLRRDAARRARESRERRLLASAADRAIVDALYRVSWDVRTGNARNGEDSTDPRLRLSDIARLAHFFLVERGYGRRVAGENIKKRLARFP